jgi:hypothetical protein
MLMRRNWRYASASLGQQAVLTESKISGSEAVRMEETIETLEPTTELTAGQKAALTRKRRAAARKAVRTRKQMSAFAKARAAEAASKEALRLYCKGNGWRVAFFEGDTGAPRTGIIDAIAFRLGRQDADALDLRLIQLKGGNAGITGKEIARLKDAASRVVTNWLIAEFDGEALHFLPADPPV